MTTTQTSAQTIAGEVKTGFDAFMKIEPLVLGAASFIPGAAPITAMVSPVVAVAAPYIDNALAELVAGNNGDAFGSFIQLLQHITKGQPNAPILSPVTPAT